MNGGLCERGWRPFGTAMVATEAGRGHPTGMHSCFNKFLERWFLCQMVYICNRQLKKLFKSAVHITYIHVESIHPNSWTNIYAFDR